MMRMKVNEIAELTGYNSAYFGKAKKRLSVVEK